MNDEIVWKICWTCKFLRYSENDTYQVRGGSPLVQGYRTKSFGILANHTGGNWLTRRALRGIPILAVTLRKDQKAGLIGP